MEELLKNPLLLIEIAKTIFWMALIVTLLILFRKEARTLLTSVASLNIGGNNFEFRNKKIEFQTYADLSDILIDILSERDASYKFRSVVSLKNAQKLKKFCERYLGEIKSSEWNYELLKNCALILTLKQYHDDGIRISEKLLEILPNDSDCLNMLAIGYGLRKNEGDTKKAEDLFNGILKKEPHSAQYSINRAILYSETERFDECFSDLKIARNNGFKDELKDPGFYKFKNAKPQEWESIYRSIS